jgi:hypothetical protein
MAVTGVDLEGARRVATDVEGVETFETRRPRPSTAVQAGYSSTSFIQT